MFPGRGTLCEGIDRAERWGYAAQPLSAFFRNAPKGETCAGKKADASGLGRCTRFGTADRGLAGADDWGEKVCPRGCGCGETIVRTALRVVSRNRRKGRPRAGFESIETASRSRRYGVEGGDRGWDSTEHARGMVLGRRGCGESSGV